MAVDDRIPLMSDPDLAVLLANARRLFETGAVKEKSEAERVLPLIEAELAERRARAPARAAKGRRAKPGAG